MRLIDQVDKIIVVAETLVHAIIVNDIITAVRPARYIYRIKPDGRYPY